MILVVVTNPDRPAAQAMESGVGKAVITFSTGALLESHDQILCYRAPDGTGAEYRGTFRTSEPGEPLR